ncbi:MAG: OmpA family protein [Planctomycetota bacterium]|jgi:chemotaxis protein MotB
MKPTSFLLAATGACLLLSGGCANRTDQNAKLRADNERLSSELDKVYADTEMIEKQRDEAREELVRLREQLKGAETQIRRFGSGLVDSNPGVFSHTAEGGIAVKGVAFKTGSADLTDEARRALSQLAGELNGGEYAGTVIHIIGHTDNTPVARAETREKFGDNWGLSAMRAASVVRALQDAGVSPKRIHGGFRGEHQSTGGNKSDDRRVEVLLSL